MAKVTDIESWASLMGAIFAILTLGGLFALLVNWVVSYFIPSIEVSWANWAMTWLAIVVAKAVFK